MDVDAGLDTGFLVGRQHKVAAAQRCAFPATLVEVKHPARLGGELGVARKDPASVAPRAQRLAAEPAPQGGATDLRHNAIGHDLALNVSGDQRDKGRPQR
jgi:hypothetical protein